MASKRRSPKAAPGNFIDTLVKLTDLSAQIDHSPDAELFAIARRLVEAEARNKKVRAEIMQIAKEALGWDHEKRPTSAIDEDGGPGSFANEWILWSRWEEVRKRIKDSDVSDDVLAVEAEQRAVEAEIVALKEILIGTRARTIDGILVKLRREVYSKPKSIFGVRMTHNTLVNSILADLEALQAAAA